jgi:hypothetical protein
MNPTLPGVDVTDTTYHPSLSLSNRLNSNDTSYVNPRESLTVVKSLHKTKNCCMKIQQFIAMVATNILDSSKAA